MLLVPFDPLGALTRVTDSDYHKGFGGNDMYRHSIRRLATYISRTCRGWRPVPHMQLADKPELHSRLPTGQGREAGGDHRDAWECCRGRDDDAGTEKDIGRTWASCADCEGGTWHLSELDVWVA